MIGEVVFELKFPRSFVVVEFRGHGMLLKHGRLLTLSLPLLLISQVAVAYRADRESRTSARGLGMGNAVINSERRSNAVFYNPANLAAKNTGTTLEVINMKFTGSDGLFAQYGRSSNINVLSLNAMYTGLQNYPNTIARGGLSVFPNFTMRNLHLGMLYEVDQGAKVRAEDSALRVFGRDRFGPVAALSFRLLSGILRIGASVEYMTIGNANKTITSPNPNNISFAEHLDTGAGLRKNAGATLTFPVPFLPSFSAVARDIGGTSYSGSPLIKFGNGRIATTDAMSIDLAAGMTIYIGGRIEIKLEADWKDFYNSIGGSRINHLFGGGEIIFWDLINFRGGYSNGYPTYGFGITTRAGSLNLAIYTDELDDRPRTQPDTRYVLQYQFGVFK
ncbi:MAG: hypothetical protein AB7F43_05570 [Bacteriovoracia bacterium]